MRTPTLAELAGLLGYAGFGFPGPASPGDIKALEQAVGRALPEALARLYREANGEVSFHTQRRPELFFGLDFMSTAEAAKTYRAYTDAIAGDPELENWLGQIESRPAGVVREVYYSRGWVPFAGLGQDNFVVDYDPGPRGTVGQIVWLSPDEPRRARVSRSLEDFLELAAASYAKRQLHPVFGWAMDYDGMAAPVQPVA